MNSRPVGHRQKERPARAAIPSSLNRRIFNSMTSLMTPASAVKREMRQGTPGERDMILSSLRVAATRSRLITNILDNLGVALREKQVDCAGALEWLKDKGLLNHLPFGPEVKR